MRESRNPRWGVDIQIPKVLYRRSFSIAFVVLLFIFLLVIDRSLNLKAKRGKLIYNDRYLFLHEKTDLYSTFLY